METRKLTEEEKEQDLNFLSHIIDDIINYAKKNNLSAEDAALSIAGWIALLYQREEKQ